jgi:hypothetical protein
MGTLFATFAGRSRPSKLKAFDRKVRTGSRKGRKENRSRQSLKFLVRMELPNYTEAFQKT